MDASAGEVEERAARLWAYVHGLVAPELAGLVPGDEERRERAYAAALRSAGSLFGTPPGSRPGL